MKKIIKNIIKVLGVILAVLFAYVLYIFTITGQFKTLEPHFAGVCKTIEGIPGTEDITIDLEEGIAYISSDDRRTNPNSSGAIFAYNLKRTDSRPIKISPDSDGSFHPHGISLYKDEDGKTSLFVINHPRGISLTGMAEQNQNPDIPKSRIEIFDLIRGKLVLRKQIVQHNFLLSPNDIHAIDHEQFYFTNDHGTSDNTVKQIHDYLRLNRAQVVFYNGTAFKIVESGLFFANGINGNQDNTIIYVAQSANNQINVYRRDTGNGKLNLLQVIHTNTSVDNIEIDANGMLWIGSHPKMLQFVEHAKDSTKISPSQILKINPDIKLAPEAASKVEEIYLSNGEDLSASSVGAVWQNRLLIGAVFDAKILDCEMAE